MKRVSESWIVLIVAAVQFVNVLDFMIVMPLGPDFGKALHIPESHLGYVAGAYTLAAFIAGVAGSLFLERFDRRNALVVALLGLVTGTAAGGLAVDLKSLLAARFLAGAFGGPATSLALAIIADVVPPERRGRAMGIVMGAVSISSIFGVPTGLKLAEWGDWRTPFFTIAGAGFLVIVGAFLALPPLRVHIEARAKGMRPTPFGELLSRPLVQLSYVMTATVMAAGFILIPNISAYVQYNIGYSRHRLGLLYLVGGVVSFGTMQLVGWLVDRFGSFRIGTIGSLLLLVTVYFGFIAYDPSLPVMAIFVAFMFSMSFRNVSYNTLTTKVPRLTERARFLSLQSAVQHLASAVGTFASAQILTTHADHSLGHITRVAGISMALSAFVPVMLWIVERGVKRQQAAAQPQAIRAAGP